MATISVWGWTFRKGYEQKGRGVRIGLERDGYFYAYLGEFPVLPVSNEFGEIALEGRHVICPNTGTLPRNDWRTDFGLKERIPHFDSEFEVLPFYTAFCLLCGYASKETHDTEKLSETPHPERKLFASKYPSRWIYEASWQDNLLSLAPSPGALIFWEKGWHFRESGALRAAQKQFPNAKVMRETHHLIVLQTD